MNKHQPFMIKGIQIYAEDHTYEKGYIKVVDGFIKEVGDVKELSSSDSLNFDEVIVPDGYSLLPGMIDIHIHGAAGADTMDATFEAIEKMANALPHEGTTSFLATTMTQTEQAIEKALENVANYMKRSDGNGKAEVLGIHLEGPFINEKRNGAQPAEYITEPSLDLFKRWQEVAEGNIKLVTLAPERPGGIELVKYLKETNAVASIGHSDATYEEVDTAILAGVSHVTHLFNGMNSLHHRKPGVPGAALLRDELYVEIIADGIHVCPEMMDLAYRLKTKDKLILITDSIRAKGLTEGTYDLGGQQVTVTETGATLENGRLAGSVLKMSDALQNMKNVTSCSTRDLIDMTSVNPAKQLNFFDRKGSIAVGKDADLVVINKDQEVMLTYCRGKLAYKKGEK